MVGVPEPALVNSLYLDMDPGFDERSEKDKAESDLVEGKSIAGKILQTSSMKKFVTLNQVLDIKRELNLHRLESDGKQSTKRLEVLL